MDYFDENFVLNAFVYDLIWFDFKTIAKEIGASFGYQKKGKMTVNQIVQYKLMSCKIMSQKTSLDIAQKNWRARYALQN